MIKRISLFLVVSMFVICAGAMAIYTINPFGVETDNVRPRLFGFDIYRIPSKSMQPLLFPGDYISVTNVTSVENLSKRKDVIVFYQPNKNKPHTKIPFIKRIIGIAGDTVLLQNGKIFVNKKRVLEKYISPSNNKTAYSLNMKSITVPQNHVFVMGDNRDNSSDSRIFGSIAETEIIAKASDILYGINNRSGNEIK